LKHLHTRPLSATEYDQTAVQSVDQIEDVVCEAVWPCGHRKEPRSSKPRLFAVAVRYLSLAHLSHSEYALLTVFSFALCM
jgi:hypothetical protein